MIKIKFRHIFQTKKHQSSSRAWLFASLSLLPLLLTASSCTDEPPDTSAPERIEIDRSLDWTGALLYIADGDGPAQNWGSVRVYDNVSGFVEATVEQTYAAKPSDLYIADSSSKMYVSSMANGIVDIFFWDGNGWRRGTGDIATPANSLLAMEPGPDNLLYLAGSSPSGDIGSLYKLDQSTDAVVGDPVIISAITEARGVTWSADGSAAFVTGTGSAGPSLELLTWPQAVVVESIALPVQAVNQVQLSPDGLKLFIACSGTILIADPTSGAITGSLEPAGDSGTDYYDVAFSADGRFLFAPGTASGGDTTLYIVDIASGTVVSQAAHVSARAHGIKRVE